MRPREFQIKLKERLGSCLSLWGQVKHRSNERRRAMNDIMRNKIKEQAASTNSVKPPPADADELKLFLQHHCGEGEAEGDMDRGAIPDMAKLTDYSEVVTYAKEKLGTKVRWRGVFTTESLTPCAPPRSRQSMTIPRTWTADSSSSSSFAVAGTTASTTRVRTKVESLTLRPP